MKIIEPNASSLYYFISTSEAPSRGQFPHYIDHIKHDLIEPYISAIEFVLERFC